MPTLLSMSTLRDLWTLRLRLMADGRDTLQQVPIPVGPEPGPGPRVLWFSLDGQDGACPDASLSTPPHLDDCLGISTPFWSLVRQATTAARLTQDPDADTSPAGLAPHVGWSPLLFLREPGPAAPEPTLLRDQDSLCFAAANEAIWTMRPTAIVMATGVASDDLMRRICRPEVGEFRQVDPDMPCLEAGVRADGVRTYWTKHPDRLVSDGHLEWTASRLGRLLSAHS